MDTSRQTRDDVAVSKKRLPLGGLSRRSAKKALQVGVIAVAVVAALVAVLVDTTNDESRQGDDAAVESLADAVAVGDVGAAAELLEQGVDPDRPRLNTFTPLMRAAMKNDVAMVDVLLDAGADLEATTPEGLTVWHLAAQADAATTLDELIALGVDLDRRSRNGMNTLEHAAAAGAVAAVRVIASTGVRLDAPSEIITQGHGYPVDVGSTPLSIAARAGHADVVATLIELGADVDAPSALGQTALIQAIVSDQPAELVKILLDAGADPAATAICDTRCGSGEDDDAAGWARRRGDPEVIALIEATLDGA